MVLLGSSKGILAQVDLKAIAARERVDPALLYAVALAESAKFVGRARVVPWPWTINSSKYGPKYFASKEQAREHLAKLLEEGVENIDVGAMQINLKYHEVSDPFRLLDPEYNLSFGARILRRALDSAKDPIMAVGRYHSGDSVRAYLYGYRVWQIYHRVVDHFRHF